MDVYNTNVVDLVSCVVKNHLKEMYEKKPKEASEIEIKKARDHVLKHGSATLQLIGADQGRY